MVCAPGAAERVRAWAPEFPGRVGLHLQLTRGRPCLPPGEVPSLVGPDGRFPDRPEALAAPEPAQALAEWRAQARRLAELGVRASHLDSHHHVHLRPGLFGAFCDLAAELGLPVRSADPARAAELARRGLAAPDLCILDWFGAAEATSAGLAGRLEAAARKARPGGAVELMCHPGLADAGLAEVSSYADERRAELEVLAAPETLRLVRRLGYEPASMDAVAAPGGRGL
jgi:predicted glycoside hydrolase/deacetylase ChbG (UPF0249 family)